MPEKFSQVRESCERIYGNTQYLTGTPANANLGFSALIYR